jgi:hypothetical protein
MATSKSSNGYTQKELNQMILDKLEKIEEKLDQKLDKAEFYKVLGLLVAVGGVVVAALM